MTPHLNSLPMSGVDKGMLRATRRQFLLTGLWLILLAAVALRIGDFESRYRYFRMNDAESHMVYVHFVRQHLANPHPEEQFEYPQEPFYYWLAASFYNPALSEDDNQPAIAGLGLATSLVMLGFVFAALRYLSSWLVRYGLLIFIGLTPAFVMHCSYIGNDGLVALFGAAFFYCLQRVNRQPQLRSNFWSAILAFQFALLTKLNAIVLGLSLPWLFWRTSSGRWLGRQNLVRVGLLTGMVAVWLAGVAHHAWIPYKKEYRLVNWGLFDGQVITRNKLLYTFEFNLPDLFLTGQTTTHASQRPFHPEAVDNVRFSFPTWTFGNMLLGAWDYNADPQVHIAASVLLVFGTIFPFGFLLFAAIALLGWPLTRDADFSPLNKTALAMTVGMMAMALHYTLRHPTVCCADFRLEAVTFAWMGYCCCRGWTVFPRSCALKVVAIIFLAGYVAANAAFYGSIFTSQQPLTEF